MKKIVMCLSLLFVAARIFAEDGIQFSHGTWKEILSQAKKQNKLVFIDVYTSWCGPCKQMVAEIFPKKEVGELFNASFINYKIDAEKGEGVEIAKKFGVRAYPTYLFVNGDGELVYRTSGYMAAAPFLQEANIALKEKDDPKPFVEWEKEYNQGKRDKAFLIGYMKKRALLKLPSAEVAEDLFALLTKEELANKDIISHIVFYSDRAEYVPQGKVFNYVMQNYKALDSGGVVKYPLGIMEIGINNYFQKNIIAKQREDMLPVIIAGYKQLMQASGALPEKIVAMEKQLPYKYYSGTNNEAKLNAAVIDYVENGLMKLNIAGMQSADSVSYAKFMEPYLTGKVDSTKDQGFAMKRINKNSQMLSPSYSLRDAAEAVYKVSKNKGLLLRAREWARRANEWFPHFSNGAVYAGLLFKTGETEKAIAVMEAASKDSFLANSEEMRQILIGNVEKMKKGKAPQKLWNNN